MNMLTKIEPETGFARPGALDRFRRLPRWQQGAAVLLPVALVAAGVTQFSGETPAVAAPPPPTVTVAMPLVRDINEWDNYVGRFEASRSVEVRPRVSGAVTAIHFADGAVVRKGQLLFTIDPRPFAAALAEARAGLASAESAVTLAEADLGRAERLLDIEGVSESDVDQLRARVRATKAALAGAQARVRARALDMEFTRVRAPIGGRISDRRIDAGNLVSAGEGGAGTLLTTINALDPIYFTFDSSEALYLKAQRDRADGDAAGQQVEIRLQDEADYSRQGRVDFTDNTLSAQSGTIRGRAVVSNPDYFLTPGMFGSMRLSAGEETRALLVPDAAVRTDQARKVVFVVGQDGTVAARPVDPGPLVAGLRSIRSGLAPNDRVVIQGIQFAMPGAKVNARPGKVAPVEPNGPPMTPVDVPAAAQATLAN
ncbi:efflux RND transporter periplasmic adaptor subunit [Sphingomonas gilva]|uniref:Efflux RND transporter periplasmic adaptor subunit n=1 Tax=Sphingomonas gilva TaxID=2305907 RepID=A0A396RRB7_9SPHN|nr:efflux RND transporter periplasmic adaptor subunit [Sphingomonas gilva]RHW19080.1 efflux RND transporter periplasmic adaptor subunit [Sphingomonas gilva]